AGHAGGEVAAGGAEHDDAAAGHVFEAVVAHAFDDGGDAGVAHREAFAGAAADVEFAAGRAVEGDVADDDVFGGRKAGGRGGAHNDLAAGEALADVVVGVAFEAEGHALGHECAEGLAGGTGEADVDGVLGQAGGAVFAGDLAAGDGADDAVDVFDGELGDDLLAAINGGGAAFEERGEVEGFLESVVLGLLAVAADLGAGVGRVEQVGEVHALGLPVGDGLVGFEAVGAADHLVDGAEAESRHDLADLLRDEGHEVDDVLGFAGVFFAEARVLGGDAGGAGIEVADAHHDAAGGDERGGGEAEFLGAEQ